MKRYSTARFYYAHENILDEEAPPDSPEKAEEEVKEDVDWPGYYSAAEETRVEAAEIPVPEDSSEEVLAVPQTPAPPKTEVLIPDEAEEEWPAVEAAVNEAVAEEAAEEGDIEDAHEKEPAEEADIVEEAAGRAGRMVHWSVQEQVRDFVPDDTKSDLSATPAFGPVSLPSYEVPTVFRDPAADVVLKSSDAALFMVHKPILTTASAFFKDMFLHAQPVSPNGLERKEVVEWSEPATIITDLLYQIYPIPKPESPPVDELIARAFAADKWGMEGVLQATKAELMNSENVNKRPLVIYKLACRLQLCDLQERASRRLVELYDPLDVSLRQDLPDLSALDFVKLCDLRRDRVRYCLRMLETHLSRTCPCGHQVTYGSWEHLLRQELTERPCGESVPAPSHLLSMLSANFTCRKSGHYSHGGWVESGLRTLKARLDHSSNSVFC